MDGKNKYQDKDFTKYNNGDSFRVKKNYTYDN